MYANSLLSQIYVSFTYPSQIDVRSENAKRFREMFDKGEVPEGGSNASENFISEKEEELMNMRKMKRAQKEFFRKMEAGELDEQQEGRKEPKLLVGKIKDVGLIPSNTTSHFSPSN